MLSPEVLVDWAFRDGHKARFTSRQGWASETNLQPASMTEDRDR